MWPNGRMECFAMLPGEPGLEERERQDAVPPGAYQRLRDDGVMLIDEGRRRARPELLIDRLEDQDIRPANVVCDRFLINTLVDAARGRWRISPRRTRWSEATEDVAAFRTLALDGPPHPLNRAGKPSARVVLILASRGRDRRSRFNPAGENP